MYDLPQALATWEQYLHEEAPDQLVQLALIHAEFEALHPFLDGNGRLGHLIVPLFLFKKGWLFMDSGLLTIMGGYDRTFWRAAAGLTPRPTSIHGTGCNRRAPE